MHPHVEVLSMTIANVVMGASKVQELNPDNAQEGSQL